MLQRKTGSMDNLMSFQMCCAASDRPPEPVHVEVYHFQFFVHSCSFRILLKQNSVHRLCCQIERMFIEELMLQFQIKARTCTWCKCWHQAACRLLCYELAPKFTLQQRDLSSTARVRKPSCSRACLLRLGAVCITHASMYSDLLVLSTVSARYICFL